LKELTSCTPNEKRREEKRMSKKKNRGCDGEDTERDEKHARREGERKKEEGGGRREEGGRRRERDLEGSHHIVQRNFPFKE
jgi:hypothetical protein